ncbi:MAG: hypothetical protein ACE5QW_02105 [Thermoplasmata archaeon]
MPLVEAFLILVLTGWTIYGLSFDQENPFFLPATGITILAASLALLGMTIRREVMETLSLSVMASIFVLYNVFILPRHITILFLFVTITAFVLLLARQRVFFEDIIESIRGEGETLNRTAIVLRNSVTRLTLVCGCAYLLSVLLYSVAIEFTYGLSTILSALFFSFLFLFSVLLLSLIPR